MFVRIHTRSAVITVNDPLDGMTFEEFFGFPFEVPKKLQFLNRYITLASELTLIHAQEMLRTGMPLDVFRELRARMNDFGIDFLDPTRSKLDALRGFYMEVPQIPLRMLFFGTPIAGKLEQAHVTSLPQLLSLETTALPQLYDDENLERLVGRRKSHVYKTEPQSVLTPLDIICITSVLRGYGLRMSNQ